MLAEYVLAHTLRGECRCGRCVDVGTAPDPASPHTVDMVFFKVASRGLVTRGEFIHLSVHHRGVFQPVDPFDGQEHGYMELGAWLGDQGIALQYMALGVMLGVFRLLSPATVLGLTAGDPLIMAAASAGYLTVIAVTPGGGA